MPTTVLQIDGNSDDTTMPDVEASRSLLRHLVYIVCPASTKELEWALWAVSLVTLFMGLNAVIHQPAAGPVFGGHGVAYYTILAVIVLFAVPVEMVTALLLRRYNGRLAHGFAEVIHRVAVVLLLFLSAVAGVGGIEFSLKQ